MRWELSDEQADFRSVLADWLTEVWAPERLRGRQAAGDASAFEERFVADGWFGVGSSEDLGGEGGGLVELALAAEELGRRAAPASAWLASMLALAGLAAAPEAAAAMLDDAATTVLAVPAAAVPGGRPPVTEDGGLLSGTVATVLAGGRARRLLVPVRGAGGTALRLVDVDRPGVRVHERSLTDRTRSAADVVLDGVPCAPVPGPVDRALEDAAHRAAVLVAADSLGVMEQMLDMTVEYAGQRRQFGVPIGSFQAVKHAAAEMLVKVESGRSIVYLAAASVQAGHSDAALHAAAAKAQVCAAASAAADTALTLHGAIGYTWEHPLSAYYKRAKLNAQLFGSPAAWNERLADRLDLLPAVAAGALR